MRKWLITPLVLLVLTLVFALPVQAAGPFDNPPGLERAIEVQEAHTDRLLSTPGIVGTAVGLENGNAVVQILTETPEVAGLPRFLDGVPVVVVFTGKIVALGKPEGKPGVKTAKVDPTDSFERPVPIGVSSGSDRIFYDNDGVGWYTTGTLGARVIKDGEVFALSNNHVYALEGQGHLGDPILQPGRADMEGGGTVDERAAATIGHLNQFVPIDFSTNADNIVDAAIASTSTSFVDNKTPSNGYGTPSSITTQAGLSMSVQKYGRTTALTTGIISGINAEVNVSYEAGVARFVNQILIQGDRGSFSKGGDSGSLIVTRNGNQPVALLFAGSKFITVGNPIDDVLNALGIPIDGASN